MNRKIMNASVLAAGVLVGLSSCKEEKKEMAEVYVAPGIELKNMDTLVKPSEDFFKYVNGTWLENNEIPADRTRWGSFDELRQMTDEDALGILKSAMASDNKDMAQIKVMPGSDQEKAIKIYETIMDTVARDNQGLEPIKPYLAEIDGISNLADLQAYLIKMEPQGGAGFLGFGVGSHPKNSDINAAYLGNGSLGLSRDYYVDQDEDTKQKRELYKAHIATMMKYLGVDDATATQKAENILAFETRLAEPRMTKEERRDARKRYNPKSLEGLKEMTPSIDWNTYFQGIGVQSVDTVIVSDPGYFKALDGILKEGNVQDWKDYLTWTLLNGASGKLTTELDRVSWEFYGRDLKGSKEQRERDERALQTINWTVGEALGKLYVEQKFPAEAKAKAEAMIKNVMLAYGNRIKNLEWMSPETKEKAIEKLEKMTVKIGYPDKWKDYSQMEVKTYEEGGSYYDNMTNVSKWRFNKDLEDLGKPVDKSEWGMSPQTVNAYFNPSYNEIVFPAAILQPPFYNYEADEAVNYGGIGAVIGHEISHCFDDSGSRYDANGNLNNWWTEEDLEQFTKLGKELAGQFSNEEVFPGVNLNGEFTLGENIGDLGGVNAAYDGLQMYLAENGNPGEIDGFTPEQRFFLSWATVWRTKYRDDALRNQIKTDPHSPGMFRAVMPLKNVDAFYSAFDVKEGDAMYLAPEDRVRIW
ncbi:M13 family metallopeptidase [Mangrovimonas futianensis]|uniref:M13 family metallopeptidase n=1 Tax=Mangrovimonas futianensis TaxID=2895523 RepID=UPI001E5B66C8|nr:M13 family metallopeptidase [Mangrovimonas futianensis]MCF1194085.1 M13 family metallopeptidase [Mangrovimonas futianensis]MCF1421814.1 M13 family metallopeptidase [Mangrovimonas futianensis]